MAQIKSSNKPDLMTQIFNSAPGQQISKAIGVPQGEKLLRFTPGKPLLPGDVGVGGKGRFIEQIQQNLSDSYAFTTPDLSEYSEKKYGALLFDATGIKNADDLKALYEFFHPLVRRVLPSGRIIVLGTTPELIKDTDEHIAQRALEGFTRSLAKEMKRGITVQLVYASPKLKATESNLDSPLRFLLSGKSAYVDAQVIRVDEKKVPKVTNWEKPLEGEIAVVTGAARGIGATISEVLARDGATVICVDIPMAGEHLAQTTNRVNGVAFPLDVTAPDAADKLATFAQERFNKKIDIIVHNAGITRDKTLAGMDEGRWDSVIQVNLVAPTRITEGLIKNHGLAEGGRVIGVSSIAGIAGNRGQTNYGTSKAGVIGFVDAFSEELAKKKITVNAVAPGFIETQMTDAIPFATREIGRRMNSLQQGGQTIDVAETIAFFANPGSAALTDNVVRVCGQSMLGA